MPYTYPNQGQVYGEYYVYPYVGDYPPNPYGWWQYPYYPQPANYYGWECPKCHHIYGPMQLVCSDCNAKQDLEKMLEEDKDGS